MKLIKYLCSSISLCLLLVTAFFAQQAETAKKPYQNIEVAKFTIRQGVEFPEKDIDALTQGLVKTLQNSKRFDAISVAATSDNAATDTPKLLISGEIIKYVKGSQAARYLIGFGAGKTKIIADVKFVDAKTGTVVHQQTVDGEVTWGIFGGDSDGAKGGVADEIIRVMKKNGLAGDKKKS